MKYTLKTVRPIAAALLMIGALTGEVRGAATTIDFSDGTAGDSIGSFYASLGVTFSNGEWIDGGTSSMTPHPSSSGLMFIAAGVNLQPKIGDPIVLTFSDPVSSFSVIANSVNANGARVDLYDSEIGGNLLDFVEAFGPSGSLNSNFILSSTSFGIRRAELYQPLSVESEGIFFDNLQFTPVPEPSSALPLAVVTLLFALRRRKLRSTAVQA